MKRRRSVISGRTFLRAHIWVILMVTLEDIRSAHERIKEFIVKTPVMTSTTINKMTGCEVFFKCENLQKVGAFKFRGALNVVLQLNDAERRRGVITHSSGNHAQALSLAASTLGIKATIVMPRTSPKVKVDATRGYGADVVLCEPTLESRERATNEIIEAHGQVLVHPYDNPRIIAGAGTATLELIEEVGALDYVFAPVGGGGLVSGTALAAKGLCSKATVIAVEPKGADDAYRSFKSGTLHPSVNPNTIADGLLTSLCKLTFGIIRNHVDDIVTVADGEIVEAMRILWERMKLVVEPSGGVSLAGLLALNNQIDSKRVGVLISGGNVDLAGFFERYQV
ncbi:MAG: threonine/serine dehydratase [Candidatus Thorarchaeota archaeon]